MESGVGSIEKQKNAVPAGRPEGPLFASGTPHPNGFTLIELAIVIVILGVMIALVAPRLGELGEANLKRSARHLTGMIRFLHEESQAKKEAYRLVFDIQDGKYWAEAPSHISDKTFEYKRLQSVIAGEGSLSGQTTFRDVIVTGHPDQPFILFTPDGWIEHAIIHLRDGSERDFSLVVNALTGNTQLLDGYVEER
jgi:prepilin-type N-terminal cleavage/methylation domain-containing protein